MKDEKIAKVTEMLLSGGKMLGYHCGNCRWPLFEFKGKVVCAVCGGPGKKAEDKAKPAEVAGALKKLEEILYNKIETLGEQLKGETDQTKMVELLNGIRATLETLERLKRS